MSTSLEHPDSGGRMAWMVAVSRPSELIRRLKHNTKWQSCLLAYIDVQYYLARSRQPKKSQAACHFYSWVTKWNALGIFLPVTDTLPSLAFFWALVFGAVSARYLTSLGTTRLDPT
jgi:hypothetical protein